MEYNDWFDYRTNVDYVMTENGTLIDPNKPQKDPEIPTQTTGDYRYEDAQPAHNKYYRSTAEKSTGRAAKD